MRWSERDSEPIVKLFGRFYRRLKGEVAHCNGELVEEASLPKDHRERWSPLVNEADLGTPLDVLLIRAVRGKQPDPKVREPDLHSASADAQVKLSTCCLRVNPSGIR